MRALCMAHPSHTGCKTWHLFWRLEQNIAEVLKSYELKAGTRAFSGRENAGQDLPKNLIALNGSGISPAGNRIELPMQQCLCANKMFAMYRSEGKGQVK